MRTLVATSFFLFPGIGVATSIRCRDLISMSRPHSLCLYCISVSRPRFDVATSFLFSSSLLLCHCSSFHVATSFSCLELTTHLCWSAYFLIATWSSGRDQIVSLISAIPVVTSKLCHNLTVIPFAEIYVATSIPCHDLVVLLSTVFCVTTLIRCRDIISFVNN